MRKMKLIKTVELLDKDNKGVKYDIHELVRVYWDYVDKILYCELEHKCYDTDDIKLDIWGIQQMPEIIDGKKNEYYFKPTLDKKKVLNIIKKNFEEFNNAKIE